MAKLRLPLVALFGTIFISTLLADNNITFKNGYPIQMIADKGVEIESSVPDNDIFFSFNGDKSASPTNMGPGSFSVVTTLGNSNVWFNGQNLFDLLKSITPPGPYPTNPPVAEKKYALFMVPVNLTTNGTFNGFELKASTNNFMKSSPTNEVSPQFYSQSEYANIGGTNNSTEVIMDKMWLFACSRHLGDVRAYHWITNTIEYTFHLETVAVLVEQNCLERYPEGDWLKESNQNLMWSWARHRNGEVGIYTDRVWRPIMPVRWYEKCPNWAKGQVPAPQQQ